MDVNWIFPTDLACVRSVLEVTPSPGGRLEWHGAGHDAAGATPGSSAGALRWERKNYSAVAAGGDRPEGFLAASRMLSVRNIPSAGGQAIQNWPQLAQLAAGIIEPRMVVAVEVKAKAEAIVAGKITRWERIRALAEFVQREISYLAVILDKDYLAGYRPHFAGDVLQNRYGDCKDKAALLVAMLRAVGEGGYVVLVAAGNPKAVEPSWPSARFNHTIVAMIADEAVPASWSTVDGGPLGNLVLFDPTDPITPLGLLSDGDQGGYGLVASDKSSGLVLLPAASPDVNRIDTRIHATFDDTGELVVKVEETSTGAIGVMLRKVRESLRNDRFAPLLETRLRETISFVQDLRWKDTWQAAEGTWRLEFDFKAPRYARRTGGDLMLLSPQVILGKSRLTPWKTRQEGFVWSASNRQTKHVRLTLPEHAKIEEMPDDWNQAIASASCRLSYRREGKDIIFESELTQSGGFLDQSHYEELRLFLQKVYEAERRPVLVRAVTATSK
jgi:hypothetical protein